LPLNSLCDIVSVNDLILTLIGQYDDKHIMTLAIKNYVSFEGIRIICLAATLAIMSVSTSELPLFYIYILGYMYIFVLR